MRILVADDDPVYRTAIQELLDEWGEEMIVANDGQEAWEILQGPDPPGIIILDWLMPRVDGFELCRRLRGDSRWEDAYVILLTGSCRREEIIKVLVAGADDYLIKPFEPLDLKIRLRTARRILNLQAELSRLRRRSQPAPAA